MKNKSGPILRPTDMHTEFNENRQVIAVSEEFYYKYRHENFIYKI